MLEGADRLILGDCLEVMASLPDGCADAIVTDPPYALQFMGAAWDTGAISFSVAFWQEALRVARPGSYLLAFGGTRMAHRMVCAIEDAGWTIKDSLMWLYGQGFPKGQTQLKPAHEPICMGLKKGGAPALNIDGCRVAYQDEFDMKGATPQGICTSKGAAAIGAEPDAGRHLARVTFDRPELTGRWPANLLLTHSAACDGACAPDCPVDELDRQGGHSVTGRRSAASRDAVVQGTAWGTSNHKSTEYTDSGGAARYFPTFRYQAKASRGERGAGNTHPTVKPLALMQWLCRLVTPPGGVVLDPFAGSATTAVACIQEGRHYICIEREPQYHAIAEQRIAQARAAVAPLPLFTEEAS